jgi:hypothetical protein
MRKEELRYPDSPRASTIETLIRLNESRAERMFRQLGSEFEPTNVVYLVEGGRRITQTELDRLPMVTVNSSILNEEDETN